MNDETPEPAVPPPGVNRREFLSEAAGAAGIATVAWFLFDGLSESLAPADVERTAPGAPPKTFTPAEWSTLEAACDRLLPSSPGSPGARDVNAIGYLDAVLQQDHVAPETLPLIRDGAARLDARAQALGARTFHALPREKQDAAIRAFEAERAADGSTPGHAWLRKTLMLVLEAFFGDPVHGGNPDEIAWAWAGHKPGFPRPEPHQKNWRPQERT